MTIGAQHGYRCVQPPSPLPSHRPHACLLCHVRVQAALVGELQRGWKVTHPVWGDGVVAEVVADSNKEEAAEAVGEGAGEEAVVVKIDFVIGPMELTVAEAAGLRVLSE